LNPQKLAGQCGKLKCCLNYELDTYLEALESFPNTETKLQTEKGYATCQKIDIFKGLLWYAYEKEFANWHELTVEKANEIIALNKKGEKPLALEEFIIEAPKAEKEPYSNVVGQDSLTRFDQPKQKGKKRRNKSRNKNRGKAELTAGNAPKNNPRNKGSKKSGNKPRKGPGNKNSNPKPPKNE
jgi:hypothetical protein